jgi:hypothetical protein
MRRAENENRIRDQFNDSREQAIIGEIVAPPCATCASKLLSSVSPRIASGSWALLLVVA